MVNDLDINVLDKNGNIKFVISRVGSSGAVNNIYRVIQHNTKNSVGSQSSLTSTALTTVSGNALIVLVSCFGNHIGATPITDSKSNTWSTLIASTGATKGWMAAFIAENITGGSGHTVTFTPTASDFIAMAVIEIQGLLTSPLGQTATSTASGTTHTAGPITANSGKSEFFIGAGALSATAEGTPQVTDPHFDWSGRWINAGASNEGIVWAIQNAISADSNSFTYTTANAQNETVMIFGLKIK